MSVCVCVCVCDVRVMCVCVCVIQRGFFSDSCLWYIAGKSMERKLGALGWKTLTSK